MSVQCIPPYTPLLYSKTGVCRGIHNFYPKHTLWVLVEAFYCVPTMFVLSENKKSIKKFSAKMFMF